MMVVDGEAGGRFERVGRPVFSPNGKTVVYVASKGEDHYLAVGRKLITLQTFEHAWRPIFSEDGGRVGIHMRTGRSVWLKVVPIR